MEKVKGGFLARDRDNAHGLNTIVGSTAGRMGPRLSLPTFVLRKHECQNDVIQHLHSGRLDFDSRLLFLQDVVCSVELGDDRLLLICGDQLHTVVQRRECCWVEDKLTLG